MGFSSPLCDHCCKRRATICCKTHLARLCVHCDSKLHPHVTEDNHDHSRFVLCNNCVSQTAVIQCLDQGLSLCQRCVSDANLISRFLLLRNNNNNSSSRYNNNNNNNNNSPLDLDLEYSSSSSCSSSLIDPSSGFPFGSLPPNNGDSSSCSGIFQNFDNYTNNYSDIQQMPMLQPDFLDILKDSSWSGFDGYKTKEEIENVLLNSPEGDETLPEYFTGEDSILTDDQFIINELAEIITLSSSLGIHTDYNIEALATSNASSQDYSKNQMIVLPKAKEETNNNLGMFANTLVQIDCGQSQLILTDEMIPWDDQTLVSNVYNPRAREEAKKRYFAKKMKRKFGKQIRYESRKSTADTKRRMKGRFTKAGAAYDYDPRANNTNKEINKIMT